MLPGMELMGCQNLAVPAEVMRHVVNVESGANPFAIGVVGGRLARQPKTLDEAVATAAMLEAKGYNYSLGLAQVNRSNFGKYGLDTHQKAFDVCANLEAGSRILAGCYTSAGGNWGKAFSCYYSGNFTTGFQQGYVQKIYDSIVRGLKVIDNTNVAAAIPVLTNATGNSGGSDLVSATANQVKQALANAAAAPTAAAAATTMATATRGALLSATERIAMRSVPIHAMAPTNANAGPGTAPPANGNPLQALLNTTNPNVNGSPNAMNAVAPNVFVPQVRGPHDPPGAAPSVMPPPPDTADLRKGTRDSAFVF